MARLVDHMALWKLSMGPIFLILKNFLAWLAIGPFENHIGEGGFSLATGNTKRINGCGP